MVNNPENRYNTKPNTSPDYKRLFNDILEIYPENKEICSRILKKNTLSCLDIIRLNNLIFANISSKFKNNQLYKAYDEETIIEILEYQKKNVLTNSQLANHFQLSRNTVAKWKKMYCIS